MLVKGLRHRLLYWISKNIEKHTSKSSNVAILAKMATANVEFLRKVEIFPPYLFGCSPTSTRPVRFQKWRLANLHIYEDPYKWREV